MRQPRWIVDQLIKPGLVLFAGAGKLGKSLLSMEMAIGIATKTQVLGELDVQAGTAIVLALEDSRARLADRLSRLTIERPDPEQLKLFLRWPALDEQGLAKLDALVEAQQPKVRTVIVDTLALCRPHGKTGYLKDYQFMRTLQRWALRRKLALICVTHLTKSTHKDFAADVAGSMGAFSSCDTLLHLSKAARTDRLALLRVVSRETGEKEIPLEMTDDGLWKIAPDADDEVRMSPERRAVIEALRVQSPQGPKAISEVTGIPHGSCRVMMSKMAKAGQLQRVRGGYIPGKKLATTTSDNIFTDNSDNTSSDLEVEQQIALNETTDLAPVVQLAAFATGGGDNDDEPIH